MYRENTREVEDLYTRERATIQPYDRRLHGFWFRNGNAVFDARTRDLAMRVATQKTVFVVNGVPCFLHEGKIYDALNGAPCLRHDGKIYGAYIGEMDEIFCCDAGLFFLSNFQVFFTDGKRPPIWVPGTSPNTFRVARVTRSKYYLTHMDAGKLAGFVLDLDTLVVAEIPALYPLA